MFKEFTCKDVAYSQLNNASKEKNFLLVLRKYSAKAYENLCSEGGVVRRHP